MTCGIAAMRSNIARIAERRRGRETLFFLTGGTGFLGSHVAAELLKKGYRVILLARPRNGLTARQRVHQLCDGFGMAEQDRRQLEVIEGSLGARGLALGEGDFLRLSREVDEIIHCASDTSFAERKRAAVEEVNIDGMRGIVDLAVGGRCYFLHYVSTAYAAGRKTGACREELGSAEAFTNVYEETKGRAEKMAYDRCRPEGIRLSIYRPSVVCGDSQTGRAAKFNGFYYPLKTVLFLKDLYTRDIRERGGQKAREMGVEIAANGALHLPIRVGVVPDGGVNLIPIDYFCAAFMELLEKSLEGGIFHIVSSKLTKVEDLVAYTKRLFAIEGIEPCPAEALDQRSTLEVLFESFLQAYRPYLQDTRIFDDRNARSILAGRGVSCPDFDFELFARCANYAVASDWGKKS